MKNLSSADEHPSEHPCDKCNGFGHVYTLPLPAQAIYVLAREFPTTEVATSRVVCPKCKGLGVVYV